MIKDYLEEIESHFDSMNLNPLMQDPLIQDDVASGFDSYETFEFRVPGYQFFRGS